MPHFVIECSENVLWMKTPADIMSVVYRAAEASTLFVKNDIKVRVHSYNQYQLGEGKDSFLHVFAYIMQGRTTEQKAALSKLIVENLNNLLPAIGILSVNISDFEQATYCNKAMIDPANKSGSRHFGLG